MVTGSKEGITGKAVWLRDDALAKLKDGRTTLAEVMRVVA